MKINVKKISAFFLTVCILAATMGITSFASETNETETGTVSLTSSRLVYDIEHADDGDILETTLSESYPILKKQVLNALKGKNITLNVHLGKAVFIFNGNDIKKAEVINLRKINSMKEVYTTEYFSDVTGD